METLKNLTILRMKIKQLIIFKILNYIFENVYTILKAELYDHDKKLFYDMWILILTTNTNKSKNNNNNNNTNTNNRNY